jgi:hypothetical protein
MQTRTNAHFRLFHRVPTKRFFRTCIQLIDSLTFANYSEYLKTPRTKLFKEFFLE